MLQLTVSLALGMAGPPQAEDFEVTWRASSECPDQEAVLSEIRTLVGTPSAEARPTRSSHGAATGLSVSGVAQKTADGFEVVLTLGDRRTGTEEVRRFRDPSCPTATRMAVLLATVAIRTHREQAEPEPLVPVTPEREPSQPIARPDPVTSTRAAGPRPERTRPRQRPWLDVSAGVVVDPTSVGAVTGGARLGVRLRWRQAAVHMRGLYLVPRELLWARGAGAVVSLGAAEAQACWLRSHRRLGLAACGGIEIGALRAAGFGVADARVDHAFWASASASVGLSLAVHPIVRLSLEPQLLAPIARPRVRFETPRAPIHRVAPLGGRVGVTVLVWLRRIRH